MKEETNCLTLAQKIYLIFILLKNPDKTEKGIKIHNFNKKITKLARRVSVW